MGAIASTHGHPQVKARQIRSPDLPNLCLVPPTRSPAPGTLDSTASTHDRNGAIPCTETRNPSNPSISCATSAPAPSISVGLAGIGLIHLLDAIGKYHETRYVFWMYIALIVGCVATAGAVLFTRTRAAFLVAAGLAASAAAGYVLSRTTGLPNATDDIGNWTEPLGLASLFVEAAVAAVGHRRVRRRSRARQRARRSRRPAVAPRRHGRPGLAERRQRGVSSRGDGRSRGFPGRGGRW